MSKNPAIIFGFAALTFAIRGTAATAEERAALGRHVAAAPAFGDARLSLLKVVAGQCAAADPLTDDLVGQLRAALDALRATAPDGQGKPRYFFEEGQYA